jgi:hypothetical protein
VLVVHIDGGKVAEVWNIIAEGESTRHDFWK